MQVRDRDFTLCATGLIVGALAPVIPSPESALAATLGYAVAFWFWPWRESKGSFTRIAFPVLIGCIVTILVFGPLVQDGSAVPDSAFLAVKVIFWLIQLEALFYIGEIWWRGRSHVAESGK
ncbi:MAG: hypothetical protein R3F01_11010 [Lysobacteraceae bacterium]